LSTIRSKIPTIEAFNCPEKSRQDLEAELKSLMHSKGEKFYNFCGFFSVILVIILSFRNEFFGLDLDLFFALLANLVLIFSFTFTYITSKFLGNMLTKFFLPSMQLEKERANLERENLEKEIEKRTAFEEALANWQYYNLVTEEGFWLAQKGQNLELAIKDLVSKKVGIQCLPP
jgi:hypothetical protein